MALGMDVGVGPDHIVLDGEPAPPKRGYNPPIFSAHVYCGQTASIRLPLGTEVGLRLGDTVLNGDRAPLP